VPLSKKSAELQNITCEVKRELIIPPKLEKVITDKVIGTNQVLKIYTNDTTMAGSHDLQYFVKSKRSGELIFKYHF
jgi:hypothetical protein